MSDLSLDMGNPYITTIGFIQGFGIGAFFMPLSAIIYSTLPKHSSAEASGLFSFGRSIGNAIGISLLTTYLSRDTQRNWNILGGHIQQANANLQHWLSLQHLTLNNPHAIAKLSHVLSTQANFIAFLHTYRIAAMLLFVAIAMILCIKVSSTQKFEPVEVH